MSTTEGAAVGGGVQAGATAPEVVGGASTVSLGEIAAGFRKFFERADVADVVEILDETGARHRCRSMLNARAEFRMAGAMEALGGMTVQVDRTALAAATRGEVSQAAKFAKVVLDVARDPAIGNALAAVFEAGFPEQFAAAVKNKRAFLVAHPGELESLPETPTALDVFSLVEIVRGLSPFFVRAAKGLAETVGSVTTPVVVQ